MKIEDEDYAIWYRDLAEEMKKYSGKVLEVKGQAVLNRRSMPGVFAFGRRVMTCCVEDIQFASFLLRVRRRQCRKMVSGMCCGVKCRLSFISYMARRGRCCR